MRREFPVGEVADLRVGDRLSILCRCGAVLGLYYVEKVTAKMALVGGRRGKHLVEGHRIKRRDIYYQDGRAWGDHYRVQRHRPGGHKDGK